VSYRRSILTAFFCTIALIAPCVAQTNTTFDVVTSNDSTGPISGWTPRNLYAVDVNNDGIPDLIQDQYWVSSGGAYNLQPVFGVSIANGDGTFKPAVPYNYPPSGGQGAMAFGDFNGDGKIDIAMPGGIHTIAIYLGRGDGTFVSPWYSVVPIAASQYMGGPIVAADFNHDGKLDLAVVGIDNTSNTVYILPGAGNGLFSSADPVLTVPGLDNVSGEGIQKMLLGNFDGDQNADLAVVATTGNQATGNIATVMVHVLYGNGDFTFDDTVPITSSNFSGNFGNAAGMNSGDLNADGKTDLFAIDADSNRLDTFYGRSDRNFTSYSQQLPSASYWSGAEDYFAPAPAMADFNDDGRNDIATITTNNNGLIYLIFFLATPSPGQFTLQTWNVPNAVGSFELPQVGDFNHDGKPDWVFNANISPAGSTFYTGLNSTVAGLWSNCDYPATGRGIHVCSPDVSSGSTVNFNAASHSFGSLRKMELWVDGKKLAEKYNTWQGNAWFNFSSTLASGTHQGDIFAADVDDTLQLAAFSFTVPSSCAAPVSVGVHICAPANGSAATASPVLVQATSTVTGTLARMEVWLDSTKKYTEVNSNSLAASVGMTAGKHTITVFAVSTSGTVWSSATSVSVP
jgi:hypothetical protein